MESHNILFLYNILTLFVLFLNLPKVYSNENVVILPLLKKNNSYLTNLKNITEIIKFIVCEPPITEFNLGTPEQKSHIIIRPDISNIYFTSYYHNKSIYDQTTELISLIYPKINYFNDEKTESIEYNETMSETFFYNNFKEWKIVEDKYNVNNDQSQKIKLNFVLATSIQFEEPGGLGLQLADKITVVQFTPSFLIQLKNNSKINNYKWFIYYGEQNEKDYLVIGCSPHEFIIPETGKTIFPKLDFDNDYFNINDQLYINKLLMEIKFDDIYITSNLTSLEKDDSYIEKGKNSFFKINLGVIIGTTEYKFYLKEKFFKDYLDKKKCFNETFKTRADLITQTFLYYYCEDSVYDDIKKSFQPLVFKTVDLSENFILTFNNLFKKMDI